jgi:hypothetical protein
MCGTFFPNEEPTKGAWMVYNEVRNRDTTLVINRRFKTPVHEELYQAYLSVIQQHQEVIFLGSELEYDFFPLKHLCRLVVPQDIQNWFFYIAKAKVFMGNQSAPLAIASALNTPRIAELLPRKYADWVHYWGEDKYGEINFVQHNTLQDLCHGLSRAFRKWCRKHIS